MRLAVPLRRLAAPGARRAVRPAAAHANAAIAIYRAQGLVLETAHHARSAGSRW